MEYEDYEVSNNLNKYGLYEIKELDYQQVNIYHKIN